MKTIFTTIIALAMFTFTSCKKESDKEVTTEATVEETKASVAEETPAFEPFKVMAVTHIVKDFDVFKKTFDEHESMRTANGITLRAMGRDAKNPNNVLIFLKIDDLQKAKNFATSKDLKEAMQKAGVTSKPETVYVDVVRFVESPAEFKDRVRVGHKVKDFDAWLKVYDTEGTATRLANGLIDRAISRNIDDPNLVYVTFAVSDMAKAKARLKDPALKKIMKDAGVISEPVIDFYTSVE
jgi:quinol monooxygenase YgiN